MEYHRDPKNQIQADIAYRLGMISNQYRALSALEKKDFSVTLDVCILQNLLVTCTELINLMSRHERQLKYLTADIEKAPSWGLRLDMIDINTFRGQLTVEVIFRRLRNALSHPTVLDIKARFPSTGYTTMPDVSGTISRYCFVNSPDTKNNRPRRFPNQEKAESELKTARDHGDMPKDVGVITVEDGQFCFGRGDKPFARVFKMYLTGEEIYALVIGLSNHLAQPIQEKWDGVTVARLVA